MQHAVRGALMVCAVVVWAGALQAHVTVVPRQSQAGAAERYTVRVPTEGQTATSSVELEIPAGVIVTEVVAGEGYTFEVRRTDDRIVAITWKKEIPPRDRAEFVFVATNPSSGPVTWKARQRFADGTTVDWAGPAGDRLPASVTTLDRPR